MNSLTIPKIIKHSAKIEKNPLSGEWLCWIPNTGWAWYLKTQKEAEKFCKEINEKMKNL